jgi:hypothetical protein
VIEDFERELTEVEEKALRRSISRHERRRRTALQNSILAACGVCGVLWLATLLASDAPKPVISGFWGATAAILTVWVWLAGRREAGERIRSLRAALEHRRARVVRIRSSEMVEFEEIEDEGACYAFQLPDDQIVFVSGQEFYADARFPNSDFSLVHVFDRTGKEVEMFTDKSGHKIEPIQRVPARVKKSLSIPDHLQIIRGQVKDLARMLARNEPAAGGPC